MVFGFIFSNLKPPPLQVIVAGYLGPESCYVYNLVALRLLLVVESLDAKYDAVIIRLLKLIG